MPTPPPRARLLLVVLAGTLGLWLLAGARASAAPVISGADGDVWNAASPVPTRPAQTTGRNRNREPAGFPAGRFLTSTRAGAGS